MKVKKLRLSHLEQKLKPFVAAQEVIVPSAGWIKTIRTSLGMSLEQLGNRLGRDKSSVARMEKREKDGSVTLGILQDAGRAMDMRFIYGFIPIDGSIEKLIEKKARELAEEIVYRTAKNMTLEDQGIPSDKIQKAIEERTNEFMDELPKKLWD